MQTLSDLTVIIPTLNEEKNITILLDTLNKLYTSLTIIVVDDNSTDATAENVASFISAHNQIQLLKRTSNDLQGLTASVLAGIEQVKTTFFAVMDGDLQHPSAVLAELHLEINKGYDLVAGARLPYKERQGFHRVFATFISTLLAKRLLRSQKIEIVDPMSGFFIARTDKIKSVISKHKSKFELAGYKVLFDILKADGKSLTLSNHYYNFSLRESGSSKLAPRHALYFFRSLFR